MCDNLKGQIANRFKEAVSENDGVPWYGLANATDIWQPVDAELLKVCIKQECFNWLDGSDNADRWYGVTYFSASEKRILVTRWVGNAYRSLIDADWDNLRYRLFQKTCCLLTADGTDDYLVRPEGIPNCEIPPPSIIDPSRMHQPFCQLQVAMRNSKK